MGKPSRAQRMGRRTARGSSPGDPRFTPERLGLDPLKYAAALTYVFDRPEPGRRIGTEWYLYTDEPPFEATLLEWVKIQTVLFSNAGRDLAPYTNDQIAVGLDYLTSPSAGGVSTSWGAGPLSLEDGLRFLQALPVLWHEVFAKRLPDDRKPIGSGSGGRLDGLCYMWFDVWTAPFTLVLKSEWREALWAALEHLLSSSARAVQVSALHGIGHLRQDLKLDRDIDARMDRFIAAVDPTDAELRHYALAAKAGAVQ